jgi:hypothetical protein
MGAFDLDAGSVSLRTLLEFATTANRLGIEVDAGWLVRPHVVGWRSRRASSTSGPSVT